MQIFGARGTSAHIDYPVLGQHFLVAMTTRNAAGGGRPAAADGVVTVGG